MKCGAYGDGGVDSDNHLWNPANCVNPRTCARCGLTEGKKNPDNHAWSEATCIKPMTCYNCGEVKGDVIGHKYDDSGKCTTCGVKQGEEEEDRDDSSKKESSSSKSSSSKSSVSASSSSTRKSSSGSSGSSKSASSDYDSYYDPAFGASIVRDEDGNTLAYKDDGFTMYQDGESGTGMATDGKGNFVADTDGDGDPDKYSTDGGNNWDDL